MIPNCRIYVSTVTETGQAVASKLKNVDGHFYLPYDLWPLTKKIFDTKTRSRNCSRK